MLEKMQENLKNNNLINRSIRVRAFVCVCTCLHADVSSIYIFINTF